MLILVSYFIHQINEQSIGGKYIKNFSKSLIQVDKRKVVSKSLCTLVVDLSKIIGEWDFLLCSLISADFLVLKVPSVEFRDSLRLACISRVTINSFSGVLLASSKKKTLEYSYKCSDRVIVSFTEIKLKIIKYSHSQSI